MENVEHSTLRAAHNKYIKTTRSGSHKIDSLSIFLDVGKWLLEWRLDGSDCEVNLVLAEQVSLIERARVGAALRLSDANPLGGIVFDQSQRVLSLLLTRGKTRPTTLKVKKKKANVLRNNFIVLFYKY